MTMLMHAPPVLFAAEDDSEQQRVDRLIKQGGAALAALALLLQRGQISKAQFIEQATGELQAHAQSAARLAAGSATDRDAIDALIESKADYLDGFADDLDSGGLSAAQIAARAALWGGLMHTAYQMAKGHEAAARATPDQVVQITWILDQGAMHCGSDDGLDCPTFADGGPYSEDTLPAHPGDGTTPCNGHCRCILDYALVPADEADFAMTVRSAAVVFAGGRA